MTDKDFERFLRDVSRESTILVGPFRDSGACWSFCQEIDDTGVFTSRTINDGHTCYKNAHNYREYVAFGWQESESLRVTSLGGYSGEYSSENGVHESGEDKVVWVLTPEEFWRWLQPNRF
jgi:hypothetical protein